MFYSSLLKSTPNQIRNKVTSLLQGLLLLIVAIQQQFLITLFLSLKQKLDLLSVPLETGGPKYLMIDSKFIMANSKIFWSKINIFSNLWTVLCQTDKTLPT